MKHIESRIARIENRLPPPPPEPSLLAELTPFWTSGELNRLLASHEHNKPLPDSELERLACRAFKRKEAGVHPGRMEESTEGMAQREAAFEFWRFKLALDQRHGLGTPEKLRYDVLDLTTQEVYSLVRLAWTANTISEIENAAHIIERLWLDCAPMTVSLFADLVIKGKLPEAK